MFEKEKLIHIVAVGFLLIAVQFIAVAQYHGISAQKRNAPQYSHACAKEAKQCPDGSYVGHVAPDCAFAPCSGVDVVEVMPLYPALDWKDRNEDVLNEFGYTLMGYKIAASVDAETYYAHDPYGYYNDLLITKGWIENLSIAVDGPQGSMWGYTRESKNIIFEYSGITNTFSIFWDDPNISFGIDTSNWQTYRNDKFGFEFDHPNGWTEVGIENLIVLNDDKGGPFMSFAFANRALIGISFCGGMLARCEM